jgi:hypothetical protein
MLRALPGWQAETPAPLFEDLNWVGMLRARTTREVHIPNRAAISSMPSHKFRIRMFSLKLC